MEKTCRICNTERQYGEYHRRYKRCNKCNVGGSLKHYYAIRDKELDKRKKFIIITEKKLLIYRKRDMTYKKTETNELGNIFQNLTKFLETLETTISVA